MSNHNTDRHRTDHRNTLPDFSKLSSDELDELADDLWEASKYPPAQVTQDILDQYLDPRDGTVRDIPADQSTPRR